MGLALDISTKFLNLISDATLGHPRLFDPLWCCLTPKVANFIGPCRLSYFGLHEFRLIAEGVDSKFLGGRINPASLFTSREARESNNPPLNVQELYSITFEIGKVAC